MTPTPDKSTLLARLRPHGQEHLLAFWDELDAAQRQRLAAQIESVDFEQIASLFRGEVDQPDWAELSRRAEPPPALRLADREAGRAAAWGATSEAARRRGEEALRDGKVGVILVAGGQGSRLGFDKPKSMYPIGPLSKATLLQIHCEKLRATARRYGKPVRMYLMTSPVTHDDTIAFVKENERFGLLENELFVFCQGTMPAVDAATGKLLLESKDSLFLSPDGHGGAVAALQASGGLEHMRQHGVEQLFYFQVDNPLAPVCDAELIGHHLLAESELSSLALAKQSPQDKLGNFVMIDGRLNVIEYSDFPAENAARRDASGGLVYWAGSVAIHVFERAFLERSLTHKDSLPFHVARKKAEFVSERGELVTPSHPNALKFERFIFDLVPHARRPIVVEYAEEESFAPLKNAPGEPKDTEEYVHRFMFNQHRRWLEAAGATLAPGVQIEISPLFALDAQQTAEMVDPGRRFEKSEYLTGG
jgi:UDP-N-acetylglucosamine/UDP-N-acetylgalactosamine diphosphorylase